MAMSLALLPFCSTAQQKVPNLGNKACPLWVAISDKAKSGDLAWKDETVRMNGWSMGYLKGIAAQYAFMSKEPNPLLKLRDDDETEWMQAFCRVNKKMYISDAAEAFLIELESRP